MTRRKSQEEHEAHESTMGADITNKKTSTEAQEHRAHQIRTSNREELIDRIKRGDRPTWVPSATFQALRDEEASYHAQKCTQTQQKAQGDGDNLVVEDPFFGLWTETKNVNGKPRSAFHSGDFNGFDESAPEGVGVDAVSPLTESPTSFSGTLPLPWSSPPVTGSTGLASSDPRLIHGRAMASVNRRRAPSLGSSLSSSFVYRTPTSPLVHALNTTNFESSYSSAGQVGGLATDRTTRRRTLPPASFHSLNILASDPATPTSDHSTSDSLRDPPTRLFSHQPRRSLSSFTYQPNSSPQSPTHRLRRLSFASESLPRRRTSMVGSFEESILRGRMSSPASQPFDFVSQIGVMGKGDCPANLKCPAHVTVPFQAVFYHYPSSPQGRLVSDDAPSPYVGTIDLEHNLKPVHLSAKRKRLASSEDGKPEQNDDPRAPENTPIGKALARDAKMEKQQSVLSKMSLGGAYRVPQKGQIQLIVKNQHKTAVKLFLVPYDLEGMNAGTKTFVRQRSYSRGPILEGALDTTAGSASSHDPLKDKHILRYLIHLRFCCPTKGKYYLHDQIRVVFANRVPDGKEKLENEVQLPEPKFSPYRPVQQRTHSSEEAGGDFANTASINIADQRIRDQQTMAPATPPTFALQDSLTRSQLALQDVVGPERSLRLPINLAPRSVTPKTDPSLPNVEKHIVIEDSPPVRPSGIPNPPLTPKIARALSPVQGFFPSTSTRASPVPWGSSSTSSTSRSFSPAPLEVGDGLLSQQFRSLYGTKAPAEPRSYQPAKSSGSVSPESSKKAPTEQNQYAGDQAEASVCEEHSELGDISLATSS